MHKILTQIERVFVGIGLGLSVLVVMELVQAYQALASIHPWAGYGFLVLLAGLVFYLAWNIRGFFQFRTVPRPPKIKPGDVAGPTVRKNTLKYFDRIMKRFEQNEILRSDAAEALERFKVEVAGLSRDLPQHGLDEWIDEFEQRTISPLLKVLDKKAESVVSDSVGLVSLGTALSPYRSADVLIVLVRNTHMVNRIIRIYRTRPTPIETIRVFIDIARVVAWVNVINATDQIWSGVGRHLPLVGKYGESISEGLFSGLLTSVAGHAAIDRCRSYHAWSAESAAREYRSKLRRWGDDILSLLKRNAIPRFLKRKKAASTGKSSEDFGMSGESDDSDLLEYGR